MKVRVRKIKEQDRLKYLELLHMAMVSLKSPEETKSFLSDLLTESEKIMLGRRILIAKRLLEDKSYNQIIEEMGVGMDTIMRVHRWLLDESRGYEAAVGELAKSGEQKYKKQPENFKGFPDNKEYGTSFKRIRKKYPLHFFLVNLLLDGKK